MQLKKQIAKAMKTAYQGTSHKDPNTNHLVHCVSEKVHKEGLHLFTEDRPGNAKAKAILNILLAGEAKIKSSTLKAFNRKIQAMVEGQQYNEELDSLPQVNFAINSEDSDSDEPNEMAVE